MEFAIYVKLLYIGNLKLVKGAQCCCSTVTNVPMFTIDARKLAET